jgi:hypothetical protein
MKYKDLKIVEYSMPKANVAKSTTGYGDPPDDLCWAVQNAMRTGDDVDKELARRNVKSFLTRYPEWTDYLNACLTGVKGDGRAGTPGIGPGLSRICFCYGRI